MNVVTIRLGFKGDGNMPPTQSRGKPPFGNLDYAGMVTGMLESNTAR
jgi:hypothetical protein